MIGEEFFAASAYLSQKPELVGGVMGQDMIKLAVIVSIILSTLIMTVYDLTGIGFNVTDFLTIR